MATGETGRRESGPACSESDRAASDLRSSGDHRAATFT